nr:MAG TPA: hypothetical protein [Crassvirales sp.]
MVNLDRFLIHLFILNRKLEMDNLYIGIIREKL